MMNYYDYYDARLKQGRPMDSKKVGNNTYAERWEDHEQPYIAIRFHATVIAKLYPNGDVQLFTGGYHTVTTKNRLNELGNFVIFQKDYQWYVKPFGTDWADAIDFYEGIKFNVNGELVA